MGQRTPRHDAHEDPRTLDGTAGDAAHAYPLSPRTVHPARQEPGIATLVLAIAISLLDRLPFARNGRLAAIVAGALLVLGLGTVSVLRAAMTGGGPPTPPLPSVTAEAPIANPVMAPSPTVLDQVPPPEPSPTTLATAPATVAAPALPTPEPPGSPPVSIPPAQRGYVPMLSYHHVRDWEAADREQDRPYIVPPAKLEAQLRYLRDRGYQSVSTAQVYAYYAEGKPLPPKPILLSFDDSYASQYTTALPLLKQYGFSATFFIMTVPLDKSGFMSTAQLQELDRAGFDIQAHTWNHQNVTKLKTPAEWQQQLVGPKKLLEKILGHPVPFFAYPFGAYDAASAAQVKAAGYLAAFALSDVLDPKAEPLFAIKRFIANSYWTQAQFVRVITTGVN